MSTTIFKKTTIDGWKVNECWKFDRAICNPDKLYARHFIDNDKGTFQRVIETKWFSSADKGNSFYKRLRKEGYEVR